MMMFGAPAHRLPSQIAATARVLEIPLSCLYLPDVMIISFDDMLGSLGTSSSNVSVGTGTDSHNGGSIGSPPTLSAHTSSLRLLRQTPALDLGKLKDAYDIYWKVIHDEVSVADASGGLDDLMRRQVSFIFLLYHSNLADIIPGSIRTLPVNFHRGDVCSQYL